jgi:stearoyl-CoA desaturase (delta-9 desaturase)
MTNTARYLLKVNLPILLLALLIPFIIDITTTALVCFIICYTLIYLISGNIYHRYWSHKQFDANNIFLKITAVLGLFTMVGDPLSYAKSHRWHHAHSDTDKDIHSPIHGTFHSLIGWMFVDYKLPIFLIRDLITSTQNKYLTTIAKHQIKIIWTGLAICAIINIQLFVGLVFAMLFGFTMEMFTNAFAHHKVKKTAVNNYVIALVSMTQLHYEHHVNPNSNEKDMGKYLFVLLEKLKLISRNV